MSDSNNSKRGAHLSDAHLPNVDEVKSPSLKCSQAARDKSVGRTIP